MPLCFWSFVYSDGVVAIIPLKEENMFDRERIEARKNNPLLKILRLKRQLANTDYQAIKYAEGEMTATEYEPIRQKRAEWRTEINRLQEAIKQLRLQTKES